MRSLLGRRQRNQPQIDERALHDPASRFLFAVDAVARLDDENDRLRIESEGYKSQLTRELEKVQQTHDQVIRRALSS